MAKIPGTKSPQKLIPRLELLEIQCRSVTIIRDDNGNILGKGIGDVKEIHSEQEFAEYLINCRKEIAEMLDPASAKT